MALSPEVLLMNEVSAHDVTGAANATEGIQCKNLNIMLDTRHFLEKGPKEMIMDLSIAHSPDLLVANWSLASDALKPWAFS
jgi:hypothetical protein